jgi:predicted MPP superfamily phosphohydrolase
MLSLCIHEKEIVLPRLPRELDGLAIVHLSDLHLSGKIAQLYFDYVVNRANELNGDLIAITGDILEHERCWDWLPHTIGRLRSRHGTCFILGNHDKRIRDVERLRASLVSLEMHDVGKSSWLTEVRGQRILLVGNELPWFGPPPEFPRAKNQSHALRILLTHSPDQISWARVHDFDLALAGHTHGGHIRLPLLGPVVCPSRFGVKYASGTFYEHPTLLHVTRGISGLDPIRLNCPPELTKLVLRCRPD